LEYFVKEFDGIIYPWNKEFSDYKYIYVDLPEGCKYVEIEYSFDKEKGCILDIGVFDPQGSFKGWSGSAKQKIYIGESSATPGYIVGKIIPGRWVIVLGIAKVVENGCRYKVIVRAYKDQKEVSSYQKCLCIGKEKSQHYLGGTWVKGDLHVHSIHSDGKNSLCEIVNKAINLGLDFIAVTDHNTISQLHEIKQSDCPGILLIPGYEITTYYGHINIWGLDVEWFDFRRRSFDDFKNLITKISSEDFIISISHPFNYDKNCIGCDFKYKDLRGFHTVEVWNGASPVNWNVQGVNWWRKLLSEGLTISGVGGSDYHGDGGVELANPTTWIYINNFSLKDIIQGIKRGRIFISKYPSGPKQNIKVYQEDKQYSIGDKIKPIKTRIEMNIEINRELLTKYSDIILRITSSEEIIKIFSIRNEFTRIEETIDIDSKQRFIIFEIGSYRDPYSLDPQNTEDLLALSNPIYILT
jgi:hypothetical protein